MNFGTNSLLVLGWVDSLQANVHVYMDSIASFHYGNWRTRGHVMWILTNQQAAW